MPDGLIIVLALLGGILPALLWLHFWLKEDKARPEPRGLIMLAFIAGMITVPLVIPLEQMAHVVAGGAGTGLLLIFLWAAIEEIMKYGAALLVVLRNKEMDEPVDAVIYMITVALGFAALENSLFLLNPDLDIFGGIITGNLRFLGATLLHVLASAVIGIAIAMTFYKGRLAKGIALFIGILLSIVLHTLFNFFIIESTGGQILTVFAFVWIGIILLLLSFERVKRITNIITRN